LRGVGNPEIKSVDVGQDFAVNTTGAIYLLNGLIPGVDYNDRIGRKVRVVGITINLRSYVQAGTGIDQGHRYIIFIDHQANGTAPSIEDLLMSVGPESQFNRDYEKAFSVLYDRRFILNASGEAGSNKEWLIDIPSRFITWYNTGTAGTVADIVTNALYLVAVGSIAAGDTDGSCSMRSRVFFTDS
jgi:hypothetical protein